MLARLFDYHTHSRFCDGKGELADYVQSALSKDLGAIGLSGHAPCGLASDWHMKARDLDDYLAQARALASDYAGRIEVLVGLEADYIPGVSSPRAVREAYSLDYVIGSVHYLGRLADGTPWTVDGPADEWARGVRESFGGDRRRAAERYFALVAEMASADSPDVIGHFDLVRKNDDGFVEESAAWYRDAVEGSLAAVAASSSVVEVNAGAVLRGYRAGFYPARPALASMARRRIPVTICSDAHRPEHVAACFPQALDELARAGYRECWSLSRAGWSAVPLDALGWGEKR